MLLALELVANARAAERNVKGASEEDSASVWRKSQLEAAEAKDLLVLPAGDKGWGLFTPSAAAKGQNQSIVSMLRLGLKWVCSPMGISEKIADIEDGSRYTMLVPNYAVPLKKMEFLLKP